jgi:hypothetical protein
LSLIASPAVRSTVRCALAAIAPQLDRLYDSRKLLVHTLSSVKL